MPGLNSLNRNKLKHTQSPLYTQPRFNLAAIPKPKSTVLHGLVIHNTMRITCHVIDAANRYSSQNELRVFLNTTAWQNS